MKTGFFPFDTFLWESHWHLLCHRSEVPRTNHFLRLQILDEEVVVFHDGAEVVVFDNRCPHRGTRIFDGLEGRQRWVCPYHGWSYAKGKLFISSPETFERSDPRQAQLNRYRTEWVGNFLFASKQPAKPIHDQLEGLIGTLAGISRSVDRRLDLNAYSYGCDWKIAVENALDQYHVSIVHKDSLDRLNLAPARDEYLGYNNVSRASIGDERVARKLGSLSRFFNLEHQDREYIAIYLFPFTFITSTFGYSYSLQQFYPSISGTSTFFKSRLYAARLSEKIKPEAMATFFESSIKVNHQVFAEDNQICSRIPADTWSPHPHEHVSAGEGKIIAFRESMATLLKSATSTEEVHDRA